LPSSIETLVQDIYDLFTGGKIELNGKHLDNFTDAVSDIMKVQFEEERGPGNYLRMSNIGKPDRQLWYDINWEGETEKFTGPNLIKFMYGHLIEQFVIFLAEQAGHKVEYKQREVDVLGIKGHIDCMIDGVVVDVKSASSMQFPKFEKGLLLEPGNDAFGYVAQLSGYRHAISPDSPAAFLAVDKTLGKLALLMVPNEHLDRYNVENRIVHAKDMVTWKEPPKRCYEPKEEGKSGNLILPVGCAYCKHKAHCWSDANGGRGLRVYGYSSGPKFFVKVVKEPRVDEYFPPV